jgi:ABC-type transporter Mla subunit MlaD
MRNKSASIVANPVLVGAVTTLVVVVAVFLAYNANKGLPFVPTYQFKIETPNAARLVVGNEIREGGSRIGQITQIDPVELRDGTTGAEITVQLDQDAGPIPTDTTVTIRPRSTLGLKYIDVRRGESDRDLPEGATLTTGQDIVPPEIDEFLGIFDEETRANAETNLDTFGGAFAARGNDLNRTLRSLPPLLARLPRLMRTLSAERTDLDGFFRQLERAASATAPVSAELARGFTAMADVFEAFSRDPEALKETISEGPPTMRVALDSFERQGPFLDRLADISPEIRATAREIRTGAPTISAALAAGTPVLRRTPPLNERIAESLDAAGDLARSPTTDLTLQGLLATMQTLNPTLRYVGPHITVCNYFTAFWTFFADHISEEDQTGTVQRIQVKEAPSQDDALQTFGATRPANAENVNPIAAQAAGDPVHLHAQARGRAVNEQGEADCESGQRGYPSRLARGVDPKYRIAIDDRTPGTQGPTFFGRPRVPEGQTFSAEPTGRTPDLASVVNP